MRGRRLWGALLVGVVVTMTGCTPRYVSGIYNSPRTGTAKFLYTQSILGFRFQGIIECKTDESGDVSDCAEKPVVYKN